MILVFWVQHKYTAQITVKMPNTGHGSQVSGNISVDRVRSEQPKWSAVYAWFRSRRVGWPIVEVAVSVIVCASRNVIGVTRTRGELG